MKDKDNKIPKKLVSPMEPLIKMSLEQQRLVQPLVDPTLLKPMFKYLETMTMLQESVQNAMRVAVNPILNHIQRINDTIKAIDWEKVSENARQQIKEIDTLLREKDRELWCLDYSLADMVLSNSDADTITEIAVYVESNLDNYLEFYRTESIYTMHIDLLTEAISAYKDGYFKLCLGSLFTVVEYLITSWYVGDLNNIGGRPNQKNLYHRVDKLTKDEQSELDKVFAQSILRVYKEMFKSDYGEEFSDTLNRHSIAHGYHNYESIKKEDTLKIFQLIKSMSLLNDVSPHGFQSAS